MMNVMCGCQLKYQMDVVERMRSSWGVCVCGMCMVKEIKKYKKENEDLKQKVECMRNIDE